MVVDACGGDTDESGRGALVVRDPEDVRGVHVVCFFFSSRRRHTRCSRDWSSDVCSSDLFPGRHRRITTRLAERIPRLPMLHWTQEPANLLSRGSALGSLGGPTV